MIVECENCSTRFQLEDERIPLAGVRVRCSRCKEAFFLPHPSTTHDASLADPEPEPQRAAAHEPDVITFDDDEDDWEFNSDLPVAGDSPPASEARPAESGRALDLDSEDSHDLPAAAIAPVKPPAVTRSERESVAPRAVAAHAAATSEVEGGEEPSFGSVEEFGSLSDDAADETAADPIVAGTADPRADRARSAKSTKSVESIGSDDDGRSAFGAATPDGDLAGDLGDPEDWDFLGGESASARPRPARPAQPRSRAADVETAHKAVRMRSPVSDAAPAAIAATDSGSDRFTPMNSGSFSASLRRVGGAIGWVVVVLLLGGVLVQSLVPREGQSAPTFDLGGVRADSVGTSWFRTAEGRSVLAVTGQLHNPGRNALRPAIELRVVLLDATGRPVDHPGEIAGVPLDAMSIRELQGEERQRARRDAASGLARGEIVAGGSVPFAAYLDDVPREAARVDLIIGERESGDAMAVEPLDHGLEAPTEGDPYVAATAVAIVPEPVANR